MNLTVAVVTLCGAVGVLSLLLAYIIVESRRRESELIDRLMARDYNEYRAGVVEPDRKKVPLRRFCTSDEQAAKLEAARPKVEA